MELIQKVQAYRQVVAVLPPRLREQAMALPQPQQTRVEELRLRAGQPLWAVLPEGELRLGTTPVEPRELEQVVEIASRASLHAVLDQVRRGYLTMEGGHRIGLCGTASVREGEIHSIRQLSSLNLRLARQISGVAAPLLPQLCREGRLVSTLILAPPGLGKTTLLRDLIRLVSDGAGCQPQRVSLADERGEVAALYHGIPQLDVGCRTDVVEGCPKAQGLMLLLRAMNPQVLAVDEITDPQDVQALRTAAGCGVTLLATAHGQGREDLQRRGRYRPLLEEEIIERLLHIRWVNGGRSYTIEELK